MELNKYSKTITQDPTQPAAQAMFYGIGLTDEDLQKAQVGVVSMGYDGNTCNMHLNDLAKLVKQGVWENDLVGLIFNTIGVSDGMSNGTDGMRYSLVSRDVIADSIEAVCGAQYYDSLIAIPGCDKNMPGALIAMGRLNRPAIMVYGGTIAPGHYKGQDLNIVSAFEALGQKLAGQLDENDFKGIIKHACPGAGACGGMYTANTMASAIEALGMSLPFSSSNPALSAEKKDECLAAGKAIKVLMEKNILPSDIMTRKAFENAITIIMALGGSTNAVLHMIAMAKSVGVALTQDDFQTISDRVPVLADFKPSGKYLMQDLHQYGGVPAVMKYLLQNGLLHGDCLTVTGKTVAENLANVPDLDFDQQKIILPLEHPVKATGHLQILYGNLATGGSVAKISGKILIGMSEEDILYFAQNRSIPKCSRRDVAPILALGLSGATTVATTMLFAHMAKIKVFATGGIGGVHMHGEDTMDVSADLVEIANTNVNVVCAGAKSILDLPRTKEYLETLGVSIVGYQTDAFPDFYTRDSGLKVDYRVDTTQDIAKIIHTKEELGFKAGLIIANPIPPEYEMEPTYIRSKIRFMNYTGYNLLK